MNKLLHAFLRKGEKSKRSTNWLGVLMLVLVMLASAFIPGSLTAQVAPVIDGNPIDWNRGTAGSNFNLFPVKQYQLDAFGNGVVDNQFTEGSKDFFFANQLVWSISQTKAKNDIANGAAIIDNNTLYFAGDRTSNNGDAQIGFWLYLNGTAPTTIGGNNIFSPPHADGDVLVLADFTGGGRNATVVIYQWYSGANPLPPGTSIVSNTNGNLRTSTLVGTVAENNDGQYAIPTGWSFPSATYDYNQFYEGKVDLTGLGFTGANLCNASFLLETRSSQSITASLDDFVGGNFNITPPPLVLTGSSACIGNAGTITSSTSVDGASYQLFNSADQAVGAPKIGTGSGLTWTGVPIGNGYYVVGAGTLPVCTSTSNEVDVVGLSNPEVADKSVCVGSTVDMGPDGTWSSSNTAVATINATTGVVTGVAPGTSTITYTNASGCSDQAIVTVNANPVIADKSVCVGSTVDMGPDGTWSSSNTAVATINATTGVVTGVAPGTSTITYTNANGCTDQAIVTVNANPEVADKSVCVGSTVDMGPDGTWSSSNTSVATINATTGVVTGVAPGTSTITYTNANGCSDQAIVTVNANPVIEDKSVCVGSTVDMGPDGTWSSSNTSVATINATTGVVTGVAPGTSTITYTNANGCTDQAIVTVNANPVVPDNSVCVGSTVDMGPDGTWSSSNTSVATINATTGVVTGVAPGTSTITYTNANGCTDQAIVTVNANPVVADKSVCVGSTVDMGPDGTWSSSNPAVATINTTTGVVTGVAPGTSTITYTNANGCSDQAIVTVNANPVIEDKSVCVGSTVDMGPDGTWSSSNTSVATINATTGVVTGVAPGTSTITYTNANGCTDQAIVTVNANPVVADKSVCVGSTVDMGPDGTWSSSNPAVATINTTTGVVTGVSAGTSTITYTNANGCTDQAIVTVYANPVVPDNSVCVGSTVDMGPDGTWSSSNPAVATINTTTGVVTGVSAGTSTITYTNANGCTDQAIVTVYANPVVPDKSVCVGSTVDMGPDGTWTSSNTAVATINATTGVVTGVAPGTSTIRLTIAGGCFDEAIVTVYANPVVPDNSVCVGSTVDMGPDGTWSSSNTSVATINATTGVVTGVAPGTSTITYTNANGCSDQAIVTVNANPVVADKSVCVGSTVDMGPDGTWSSSNTSVATINATTGVVTGVAPGTSTITYTNANGCTDQAIVTVNANPVVPDNSVCVGSTVDMGPDGTWSSSNTSVATINATTGVVTGVAPGTSTITYTNANGCSDQAIVTVNANPVVADKSVCVGSTVDMGPDGTWSSSNTSVATINATTGVVTGVAPGTSTITYTNANGCTDQAIVTVNPNTSSSQRREICANLLPYTWDGLVFDGGGSKSKTGLINQYGCDSTANYTLVVNPLPIISCSATPTLIDITSAAHNTQLNVDLSGNADTDPTHYTYAWTEDGAGSFNFNNINNPVYTAGVLDAGQVISFTVTVTNKATGCTSTSNCSVTVNSAGSCPGVPTSEVCNGSTNTYTADRAATANETWKWSVNNGAAIVGADNGQSVTVTAGSQGFTLTLTVSYANTELSPTVCTYQVTTIPCGGYCTYTQGKYGNKSPACDGDGNGDGTPITYASVVDMIKAMLGVGGVANPLYIGGDGITKPRVTIPATATAAVLLNASMPGGSTPRELIGNCTVDNAGGLPACWTASNNPLTSYLTKQGKINNVFLSQTIALGLNMRVSGGLGGFALQAGTFATAKAVGGCGSTTPLQRSCYLNELGQLVVVNEYTYRTIGQDIIDALTCKGYPLTVAGLYQLANDGLANADGVIGSECGAGLSSISGAVAAFNEGFDECRIAIGWNVGPCEIPTRRININTSGVINSPDLNAQMVDAIRVSAYPNPFAEKVSFVIVSPVSGKASLEVYNMFGQKLQTVFEGYMTAGRNQLVEYRPGTNAAGTLIYKFSIDGKQVTGKLINLKQ